MLSCWRVGLIVVLSLCVTSGVEAYSKKKESIAKLFEGADAVVLARISDEEKLFEHQYNCGTRYTGVVLQKFKGDSRADTETIIFGRHVGHLDVDRTYLIFLTFQANPEAVYRELKEEFKTKHNLPDMSDEEVDKRALETVKCKGLIPGFIFDTAAWLEELSYVIITGLLPDDIPETIRIYPTGSAQWWMKKEDLFSYLRTLGRRKN